jgi:hypothetical protein
MENKRTFSQYLDDAVENFFTDRLSFSLFTAALPISTPSETQDGLNDADSTACRGENITYGSLRPSRNLSTTAAIVIPAVVRSSHDTRPSLSPEGTAPKPASSRPNPSYGCSAAGDIPESPVDSLKSSHKTETHENEKQDEDHYVHERNKSPVGSQTSDDDLSDLPEDIIDPRDEPEKWSKADTAGRIHSSLEPLPPHKPVSQPGI